jgi:hypothetical protein
MSFDCTNSPVKLFNSVKSGAGTALSGRCGTDDFEAAFFADAESFWLQAGAISMRDITMVTKRFILPAPYLESLENHSHFETFPGTVPILHLQDSE